MFNNGFPKEWSTLRKLAWLYRTVINAVSAVLKTITGNPIHILDALAKPAQALSVKLEPIQDLHGYDNPWPAGGGKNIVNLENHTVSPSDSVTILFGDRYNLQAGTYTLSWTLNKTITATRNRAAYTIGSSYYFADSDSKTAGRHSWTFTLAEAASLRFGWWANGVSENVTISDFQLELGSAATSYAPYSNICPISGHTDADVTRTGKNLFRLVEAEAIKSGYDYYIPNPIPKAGSYKLTCQNAFGGSSLLGCAVVFRDSVGGTNIGAYYAGYNFGNTEREGVTTTITAEQANAQYIVFLARSSGLTFSGLSDAEIQIELGSTASSYSPYVGTTYPIPLGTTVYGGTLDVLTGVLTVDRALVAFNGSETWYDYPSFQGFYTNLYGMKVGIRQDGISNMLIDSKSTASGQKNAMWLGVNSSYFFAFGVYESMGNTLEDFKSFLSSNNLQVVYPLATPFTIQLTGQQVELLQGENNLFSDGEMTLVYLADGNASDEEALNILLGGRYVNNHEADEPSDREALDIVLGGKK